MSQILAATKSALIQDIVISKKKLLVNSSASFAKCQICGKGLEDGYSITAKSIPSGTTLFCELHYEQK